MSETLARHMHEDRLLRDAARALVDADIANLRADLTARSIPTRLMDRVSEGATDVLDEAVAVAEDNKGVIAALALVHLALVALVVGLVFALSPLLTAWGATGLVVGVLSIAAVVLALAAKKRFGALSSAFGERK